MKPHLLYADRDLGASTEETPVDDLETDLELVTVLATMAGGDRFLYDTCRTVIRQGLDTPEQVIHRQEILRDCLARPEVPLALYEIAVEALTRKRDFWFGGIASSPTRTVHQSVRILGMLLDQLEKLRTTAQQHEDDIAAPGWKTLFASLSSDADDGYIERTRSMLAQLDFPNGTRLSARLSDGNEGAEYELHVARRLGWWERLRPPPSRLTFHVAPRDEAGHQALEEIRNRALLSVADALAQARQHLLDFFATLRFELAFYLGAVNLDRALDARGMPRCFPEPTASPEPTLHGRSLYDPSLALLSKDRTVGNDIDAGERDVIVITGANRGGKSTLLRSLGLAQLMLQAGLFVPAERFRGELHPRVWSHFKREEEADLVSGKFDEELVRMEEIVEQIQPGDLMLFNESFASTNEREGSEIALGIVSAMRASGVKVIYVTHMFELADALDDGDPRTLFLRAEPPSSAEPFVVHPGPPEPTSHADVVYRSVFGRDPEDAAEAPSASSPRQGTAPLR